jgi:hypothetical protein
MRFKPNTQKHRTPLAALDAARLANRKRTWNASDAMAKPATHRDVYYYQNEVDARVVAANLHANGFPSARVVSYTRGYAIQREKSGQYFGPYGFAGAVR